VIIIAFTAFNFIYDDVPTEHHGLVITNINGGGESISSSGSQITPISDHVFRDPVHHLLAIDQGEPLQFEIELTSQKAKDRFEVASIARWLTEQDDYKKLQIDQFDLKNVYFNCLFTNMSNIYYQNNAFSFRCTVVCDAPWAWEWEKTRKWSFKNLSVNTDKIFNTSSSKNLLKPIVGFTLAGSNTSFSIVNKSMNDLTMSFTDLLVGEKVYIDCRTYEVKSLSRPDIYIIDKFNKKFLGFKQGMNVLEFRGLVDDVTIKYQYALKVGV